MMWRAASLARRAGYRLRDRLAPPDPAVQISALLDQLRARKGVVRIGFVVCDASKWSAGPLFNLLAADPAFRCCFHLALSDAALRLPMPARRRQFEGVNRFYAALGPIGAGLYNPATDRMQPPGVLDCDLAIIQQPWGMQDLPRRLLHQGILSAYVHYGYPIISNDTMQFGLPDFHRFLWAYVAASDLHREMVVNGPSAPFSVVVAGHPKLDSYLSPAPARGDVPHWPRAADSTRRRVIFAPHHTLDGTLNMATFAWSGAVMLDLARTNPDVDFLLKPHPNLALAMERGGEGQRYGAWLRAWSGLANAATYDSGNYFDLFRTSDLLITDSGSFLAEYLPTGSPILRLMRPDGAPMNRAGAALLPAFYTAANPGELRARFEDLVLRNNDPLAALRARIAALVAPRAPGSARILRDRLLAELR